MRVLHRSSQVVVADKTAGCAPLHIPAPGVLALAENICHASPASCVHPLPHHDGESEQTLSAAMKDSWCLIGYSIEDELESSYFDDVVDRR